MRIVFMGTPEFAVPSLKELNDAFEVALVVTRPDAVRGRGKKLEPSPVKACAQELCIDVVEANRITDEVFAQIEAASPDIICVAAYGCILPDRLLKLAPLGCVNVHASLLPRWRGAAPVQRAVLAGDERVGVSIMKVVHELDAGAYCAQGSTEVADENTERLLEVIGQIGAKLLVESLPNIADGSVVWTEQDEALVTYAHKIEKAEMLLDPAEDVAANARRVQASADAAPARCVVAGKGVRVTHAAACADVAPASGAVEVRRGRVVLGCADGGLELLFVKPDGKREMAARDWAAGLRGEGLSWERA